MKKITVLLTTEQHKRFVNAKIDRGLSSLQALLVSSTETVLDASEPGTPGSKPTLSIVSGVVHENSVTIAVPKKHQKLVQMLTDILGGGDTDSITAVKENLKVFHKLIQPQPQKPDHGKRDQIPPKKEESG